MNVVRWLHFSDVHFDAHMATNSYDIRKTIDPLLQTIADWRTQRGFRPDLVFFTGDIANRGTDEDFAVAGEFFEHLFEAAEISPSRVWLAPGNHDVHRPTGRALLRTLAGAEESDDWFFADPIARASHLRKFAAYIRFLDSSFAGRPLASGDAVHEPAVVMVRDVRVGVLPLNTAWFCQDDADQGKLWVGTRLVRSRIEALRRLQPDVVFSLMHHPYAYLHEEDTSKAWIRDGSNIVLRGHLHAVEVDTLVTTTGNVLEIAAGAIYQGGRWPCRAFFAELDMDQLQVSLYPITYVDKPSARSWVLDTSVFPDRELQGYRGDFRLIIPSSATVATAAGEFPHRIWTAVNTATWLTEIVDWFSSSYPQRPEKTMEDLLSHVFAVLTNAKGQSNLAENVTNLGTALRPHMPTSLPPERAHHETILQLLELGLHRNLSHLFMLPRMQLRALLDVPAYSRLLRATRHLGSGEYRDAIDEALQVGAGCCVALYVMAQSDRKLDLNYESESKLDELGKLLDRIQNPHMAPYPCTASRRLQCLCNRDLLRAEYLRARAVVARRIGDSGAAERLFEDATIIAELATKAMSSDDPSEATTSATLTTDYDETPHRVLADVNYSHGYYWYDRGEFAKASELFRKSIAELERAGEEWDPPYTRLAIIQLIMHETQSATTLMLKAHNICRRTSPRTNREAPLSESLCAVGLKVLEAIRGIQLTSMLMDPLRDLERALVIDPPLAMGPLSCHANDARLLMQYSPETTREVVAVFVRRLEEAQAERGTLT
jgi:3',5'-cyclic AMP phosphodiesterase CpdA/tetratricopeptide (TPR) repeat protein